MLSVMNFRVSDRIHSLIDSGRNGPWHDLPSDPWICSSWWRGPPVTVLEMDMFCYTVSHRQILGAPSGAL